MDIMYIMNNEIEDSLNMCIFIGKYIYKKNPNNGMPIKHNSVIPFSTKKRLCDNTSMSGDAHYHNSKPHRICIKQKFLKKRYGLTCKYEFGHVKRGTFSPLYGNLAIIELMCHELAHHRTKGHGKKWYAKYNLFMLQITKLIISGNFYNKKLMLEAISV